MTSSLQVVSGASFCSIQHRIPALQLPIPRSFKFPPSSTKTSPHFGPKIGGIWGSWERSRIQLFNVVPSMYLQWYNWNWSKNEPEEVCQKKRNSTAGLTGLSQDLSATGKPSSRCSGYGQDWGLSALKKLQILQRWGRGPYQF